MVTYTFSNDYHGYWYIDTLTKDYHGYIETLTNDYHGYEEVHQR